MKKRSPSSLLVGTKEDYERRAATRREPSAEGAFDTRAPLLPAARSYVSCPLPDREQGTV